MPNKTEPKCEGLQNLTEAVKKDCAKDRGCFNPEGCNAPLGKACFHCYCDKLKWVIERAKHYEEKLGVPWEEILNSWEADRSYWYMNYYQDANQPKIEDDKVRVFETVQAMLESIGKLGFRCPFCGGVSTSPYICDSGLSVKGKVCDWKVGGLFRDMGKGVYVYCKDKLRGERIFMPLA